MRRRQNSGTLLRGRDHDVYPSGAGAPVQPRESEQRAPEELQPRRRRVYAGGHLAGRDAGATRLLFLCGSLQFLFVLS